MRLTGETKFFAGIILITIVILVAAVFLFSKPPVEQSETIIPVETLAPQDAWATGSAQPKATLVEFSDFECPACGAAQPVIKGLMAEYKDDLRLVYRHFPLDQHPNAQFAAQAAEAAGAQGKFWEMHDLLFQGQADLSRGAIENMAQTLGLNLDIFKTELDQAKYKEKIDRDETAAIQLGVNQTPTFYLNGKKLTVGNFNQLKAEIEKAITEPEATP